IVGCFMVLMGLNLYGLNFARKFLPKMPKKFRNLNKNGNAPFVVGLLNGLMPCGPLQSMQLYALSTGSFYQGALAMFLFSIGTVPLMYVFGKIGEFKNPNIAKKFMKISAVLVLILGVVMANRGVALLGLGVTNNVENTGELSSVVEDGVQIVYTDLSPRGYPNLILKKNVPVKWVINATEQTLTGCNNEIIINEYGISKKLELGENIIEFIPNETGNFKYSCWMGMIRATITIID
ncbi:MAG: sulfite exporter TauE/SafE family protein, partial [Lachnospirales bacterium]